MNIVVIDAQGGGIGKQLVTSIKQSIPDAYVMAVGTNPAATQAMMKAGADIAATGENSVRVACRKADVIVGPIGIVIADSMLGEITPEMATAVAQSEARLILIPFSHQNRMIVGMPELPLGRLIQEAVRELVRVRDEMAEE